MEYSELADYDLPGGTMLTWEPTAHPTAWRDDERRLSYMHLEHVRRAISVGDDWYSQWIGTAWRIALPLDRDAMSETIETWYRRHEAFRTSVRQQGADAEDDLTRITLPADSISVRPRLVGTALSAAQVQESTTEFFNSGVSPLRWPHCVAVTIEPTGDDTGFVLVFAADHTVMDAYTQVFAIRELTALYTAALNGTPHGLADFGSYLDFSHAERQLGDQLDANNSAVAQWREFFETTTTAVQPAAMPEFPVFGVPESASASIVATRPAEPGYQTTLSDWLLDASDTKRFNDICRSAGVSMTVGVYTALSMTAAALAGDGDLRFISPVHTRNALEWGEAAGWFVGIIPVALRTGGASTFLDALGAVAASSATYKDVGAAPFAPIADLIGGDATPPGFVVSYIDLRKDPGAAEWTPRNARVLRSATADADEVYLWINRIPDGTNISSRFPTGERGRAVEVFISTLRATLAQVVAEGDCAYRYTPAVSVEAR